jgi:hypothetical protein
MVISAVPGSNAAGSSGSSSQSDVEQLISQAQSVINNLPADKRQEMEAALAQLRQARASNNHRELTSAIVRITMLTISQS